MPGIYQSLFLVFIFVIIFLALCAAVIPVRCWRKVEQGTALIIPGSHDATRVVEATLFRKLSGMFGNHPLIEEQTCPLNYNDFIVKLAEYDREIVPRFEAYRQLKKDLLEREREKLRLEEFRTRILTSFVRNRLIDQVYLPLFGD